MNKIIEKIRKEIVPSKKIQDERRKIADMIIRLIQEQNNQNIVGVELGGSFAKGTWLAQKADIDVFVKFKNSMPDKKFRMLSEKIGFGALKKYKPYTRYSEHPFVEAMVHGVKVNVVPCYNVKKGEWKSSADRSQFHTKFMLKELDVKKQNEVRILKQFLKSNNVYGAEMSKQGFSGYVCEVLVWNLGGFKEILERFAVIQKGDVIGHAARTFDTTISIIDPIDGNRNLAAAVSDQSFASLVLASRAFLIKPSLDFFRPKKPRISKEAQKHMITIEFVHPKQSPDIIWGQIRKASASLTAQLNSSGFNVIKNAAFSDDANHATLAFLLESHSISKKHVRMGPEIFSEKDLSGFIAKNRSKSNLMWVDKSKRVMSLEDRKFISAEKFLYNLLEKSDRSGIPKGLQKHIKKGFTVSTGGRKLQRTIKEELLEFVSIDEKIFSVYK